jgi:hypothetical protein
MTQTDFFPYTRAVPFKPYRIHLTDGTVYRIDWPDMVMPLPSHALVVVPTPNRPDRDELIVRVPFTNVSRLEPEEHNARTESLAGNG